jgi:Tfp pilus assembly protein PilN
MKPINLLTQSPHAHAYRAVHRWFLFSISCTITALTVIAWMQFSCWMPYHASYLKKRELMRTMQNLPAAAQQQQKLALEEKALKKTMQTLSHYLQGNKNPLAFLNHIKAALSNTACIEQIAVKNKNIEIRMVPNNHETLLSSITSLSQHELCANISIAELSQKEKNKILATLKSSHQTKAINPKEMKS